MVARNTERMLSEHEWWQAVRLMASGVLALSFTVLVGIVEGRVALAATQIVTTTADSGPGSLREAIATAASGDTMYFEIPDQDDGCGAGACVITLTTGQLSVDKDLAIYGPGAAFLTIERSDRSSTPAFRIFSIEPNRTVTMSGLNITNGFVVGGNSGGGIFNAGTLTLANSAVIRNTAEGTSESSGGGIANAGTLTLNHSVVLENSATGMGGGVASAGPLTISSSNIWRNRTIDGGRGGGLMFGHDTTVSNSLFFENVADSDDHEIPGGGAIYGLSGTLRLTNSTISGNSANRPGGGIVSDGSASMVVSNVTLSGNVATNGAGTIARLGSGTVTVRNTIIVKAAGAAAGQSCSGNIALAGNNISDDGSCGMTVGDPRLGSLEDHGGPVMSHMLEAGSAATDAGDVAGCKDHDGRVLTTDTRGAPRPQGSRCDLGAFEVQTGSAGDAPPLITAIASLTVVEDAGSSPRIDFLVYDSDVAVDVTALRVTAVSVPPTFLPAESVVVFPASSLESFRTLRVIPPPDANGTATITLTVTDGNGKTASTDVRVTVLAVNDAPSFVNGPAQVTVLEDSGAYSQAWATGITTGPANEVMQTATFDVTNNLTSLFEVQPAISSNGTLTFTPAANANGTATVSVVVSDGGGTANGGVDRTPSRQFSLTVTPVNDRPTFVKGSNVTVQQDSGKFVQANWAQSILAGPRDESTQSVVFQAGADRPELFTGPGPLIDISPTGSLAFTPAPGATGTATVSVVLQDDGGTANGGLNSSLPTTFTITIAPPNKPPTAKDDSFTTGFNTALNVTAPGVLTNDSDPEGQALRSVRVKEPLHGSLTLNGDGSFTYTPTTGYSGPDTFTYKASDGTAESEVVVVRLTVAGPVSPQACAPRPNPSLQSVQIGPGRLRVTVTAQTNAGLPGNALTKLEFGETRNARVEVQTTPGGPFTVLGPLPGAPAGFTMTAPANAREMSFVVQRLTAGDFKAHFVVVDGCPAVPFKTFVGGGSGVQ